MKSKEEQAELHKAIWNIAENLRGSVSGWEFKAYVLGTLFYRFISEKLENSVNADEAKSGNSNFAYGDITDKAANGAKVQIIQKLGFFISPSHLFRNVHKNAATNKNLNVTLGDVFREIEDSTRGTEGEQEFKGLFAGMNFNSTQNLGATVDERNEKLADLLDGIAKMKLGDFKDNKIDAFGDAYEYLMKMYASFAGKSGGEFFTPQEVSRLLALITTFGKKKVKKAYDPACGSGSLLMQVAKVIGKENVLAGFFGQEKEPTIHQLCRMNMFLHDIDPRKFDIALGDTLKRPCERHVDEEPFTVIVSNPPYSLKWDGDGDPTLITDPRFAPAGVLAPRKYADFAFILHSLSWLAEDGCAAIVCFPGIFSRGGAEQKIRKYLVENNFIDALIDLPPNLFFGTPIATTVLVLRKNKKNDTNVLFIDAEEMFVKDGNKNKLTDENIEAIFKLYTDRKEVRHVTRLVSCEKIAAENYNLSVSTYVEPKDNRPKIDIKAVNAQINEIVARVDCLRASVTKTVKEIGETEGSPRKSILEKIIARHCPNGIEYKPLGEVLKYEQPSKYIVHSTEYDDSFATPVLTAGQSFILGYTDEEDNHYQASKASPVIIFDDFTTATQWVDFEFKVKSSAMKILSVKDSNVADIRFVYFAIQCIRFSPGEHARHWIQKYSKFEIPFPPLAVQKEIARMLDDMVGLFLTLDEEITARKKQYEWYRDKLLTFKKEER